MSDFLTDTFAGTAGTNLSAHSPNIGGTWASTGGAFTGAILLDGAGGIYSTGLGLYSNSASPGSSDYYVQATVTPISSVTGQVGVAARMSSNFYFANYLAGSGWQIYKNIGGSITQLGSTYAQTLTVGTGYVMKLVCIGTAITLFIDGVSRISATDASVTAAGVAGALSINSSGSGLVVSNLSGAIAAATLTAGTASFVSSTFTTISVSATAPTGGTTPYSYQWQRSTTFGSGYANVSGATSLTFTDTSLNRATTYYYRLNQTDGAGTPATVTTNVVTVSTKSYQMVADGNSQTFGAGGTSWATQIAPFISPLWQIDNIAVSGQTTRDMTADALSQVVPYLNAANALNLVVAQEVMNDIYFGQTGAQAYANLQAYCAIVRGVNGSKVLVICPQPTRGDFPGSSTLPGANAAAQRMEYTSRVADFTTLFRAGWFGFCDGFFDPGSDLRLSDYSNATYYSGDLVHWNTTGESVVANGVAADMPQTLYPNTGTSSTGGGSIIGDGNLVS